MSENLDNHIWVRTAPFAGLIPQGGFEIFVLVWAFANVLLTLLPVLTLVGNSADMVLGFLPMTILWSYSVFVLNFLLGLVYFYFRAWPWAENYEERK